MNRGDAVKALAESLKTTYPNGGFILSPSVEFSSAYGGRELSVVAKSRIKKDEVLFVIPRPVRLSANHVLASESLQVLHQLILKHCGFCASQVALAVAIMHVLSKKDKGADSSVDSFVLQAATWPSESCMKETSIFYWDDSKVRSVANQSGLYVTFERHISLMLRPSFEDVSKMLMQTPDIFIDSSLPSNQKLDNKLSKEALWNTFVYAFSLVWSRSHGTHDNPSIVPLLELCNGHSQIVKGDEINVEFASGNGSFLPGGRFVNEIDHPCSGVFANRDIAEGEELILSYGPVSPVQFMIKYGAVPETFLSYRDITSDITLFCDPSFIPEDPKRVKCLEKNYEFPLNDLKTNPECPFAEIVDNRSLLEMYQYGKEPDVIRKMRHFLILSKLANDSELERNLKTGRVPEGRYHFQVMGLMIKLIDHNLKLLTGDKNETSKNDVERAKKPDTPVWEKAVLMARVSYRESLIMWRHEFSKLGNVPLPDGTDEDALACLVNGGCSRCGRTYPSLLCSRCKKVKYCCREHQRIDWKDHKLQCCK
mmetsp:Transcript_32764/g.49380  ORF Transcript_32764/g.49380 Transcript_32764/m.49380 type:complete len:538 (-) Transcript_32764:188-1801(-)